MGELKKLRIAGTENTVTPYTAGEGIEISAGRQISVDTGVVATKTDLIAANGNIASEYDSTATYSRGDYCIHEGVLYYCENNIETPETWDSSNWTAVVVTDELSVYDSAIRSLFRDTANHYSPYSTYSVGDYCLYNELLYRCTTAITTAEAWTAAHWTQVTIGDELSGTKGDLSEFPPVKDSSKTGVNLDVSDEDGYVVARFQDGNFQTENFDSRYTPNTAGSNAEADLDIADANGFVGLRIKGGHIKTENFDSEEAATTDNVSAIIAQQFDAQFIARSRLYGVKWDTIGDSITAASTVGSSGKNYTKWISEANGMSLNNVGVGGKGWWDGFEAEVANIRSDTDIVTIMGSLNDIGNYIINPGTPGDQWGTGTTGYCARAARVLNAIYAVRNDIRIGIILPTPWVNYNPFDTAAATQADVENMLEALTEIGHIYDIPVLDMYHNSNLRPWDSDFRTAYFVAADGYHPNTLGHKLFVAPQIEAFVRSLAITY